MFLLHLCFILMREAGVEKEVLHRHQEGERDASYQGRLVFVASSLFHLDESRGTFFT